MVALVGIIWLLRGFGDVMILLSIDLAHSA
jgi:hypothetical protein